jgi:hypothetical protein
MMRKCFSPNSCVKCFYSDLLLFDKKFPWGIHMDLNLLQLQYGDIVVVETIKFKERTNFENLSL